MMELIIAWVLVLGTLAVLHFVFTFPIFNLYRELGAKWYWLSLLPMIGLGTMCWILPEDDGHKVSVGGYKVHKLLAFFWWLPLMFLWIPRLRVLLCWIFYGSAFSVFLYYFYNSLFVMSKDEQLKKSLVNGFLFPKGLLMLAKFKLTEDLDE